MHVVSSAEGKLNFQLIRGNALTWLVAASSEYVDFLCYCFCLCNFFSHYNQHCPWSLWVVSSGGVFLPVEFRICSIYLTSASCCTQPCLTFLLRLSLWLISSKIRENDSSFLPAGLALHKDVCDAPRIVLVWIIPQASCWCYFKYFLSYKQLACSLPPIWHFLSVLHTRAHMRKHTPQLHLLSITVIENGFSLYWV